MKNDKRRSDSRVRCAACHSRYNPGNSRRARRHEAAQCVRRKKEARV